jgi:hypothetical protein
MDQVRWGIIGPGAIARKGHKQGQIDDLLPWNYPVTV